MSPAPPASMPPASTPRSAGLRDRHLAFSNASPAVPRPGPPVCAIAVDAEEDFDWLNPVYGTRHTAGNMGHIRTLQEIAAAYRLVPTYLLTYPILDSPEVVSLLRRRLERGECEAGVQLHPWVTPPYDAGSASATSFAGYLAPELERRKLMELVRKFTECFGFAPSMYRAGRYGLGEQSIDLLEELGFTIDTSLAPRTSFAAEGGPDFSGFDYRPFWFGKRSRVLELPLCREVVGWSGALAPALYRAALAPGLARLRLPAMVTRARCAERITLSPEGNDIAAMRRLVRRLLGAGQRLFALSFHSSSLVAGRNPYVQTKADLHGFYDRLSAILEFMADGCGMRFSPLSGMPAALLPPGGAPEALGGVARGGPGAAARERPERDVRGDALGDAPMDAPADARLGRPPLPPGAGRPEVAA